MDELKDILKRPWIDSLKMSGSDFAEKWKNIGVERELTINSKCFEDQVKDELNLSDDQISELESNLDVSNLVSPTDKDWSSYIVGNYYQCPSHINLKSLRPQLNHLNECTKNDKYRTLVEKSLRYRNDKFTINATPSKH